MNLMEELPSKSSPEPMVFTKSANNNNTNNIKSDTNSNQTDRAFTIPALGFFDLDLKMMLIIILLIVVILTYMGINILYIMGDGIQSGVHILSPAFVSFLDMLGNTTGTAINKVSEVTADVATTGIDLADGAVHSVGNILIGDETLGSGQPRQNPQDPRADVPENSIQKSLTATKTKWCLAGEYQNKRGCIAISESDKCMSGEVFPNEESCILNKPQFQSNNQQ